MKIDQINISILKALQGDATLTQRALSERVGLSQNACWRRLKAMEDAGLITGRPLGLNRERLGLGLVVFTMIRTRSHSAAWLKRFRAHVTAIPDVIDFYRIGGDYDYMLKIVTHDMTSFDGVYQALIAEQELDAVTSYFAMEAIAENRPLPLRLETAPG